MFFVRVANAVNLICSETILKFTASKKQKKLQIPQLSFVKSIGSSIYRFISPPHIVTTVQDQKFNF
jgi:hypothetical protein